MFIKHLHKWTNKIEPLNYTASLNYSYWLVHDSLNCWTALVLTGLGRQSATTFVLPTLYLNAQLNWCHCRGWSCATLTTILFNVPTHLSHRPAAWGWLGVLNRGWHPNFNKNSRVSFPVKLLALSLHILTAISNCFIITLSVLNRPRKSRDKTFSREWQLVKIKITISNVIRIHKVKYTSTCIAHRRNYL